MVLTLKHHEHSVNTYGRQIAECFFSLNRFLCCFFPRHPVVPQRDAGADVAPLVQTGEGLQNEERTIQHQQDPGHLRLHQVRRAAQQLPQARPHDGDLPPLQGLGRHRHPTGRALWRPFSDAFSLKSGN